MCYFNTDTLKQSLNMNDNPFSNAAELEPTPSVSSAAGDLRAAADDFKDTTGAQASNLKDKAVETAQALRANAAEKAEHYKTVATEKAEHYKAVATEKADHYKSVATEKAQHAKDTAQKQWEESSAKAKEFHVTAEDYIRQNPTKAVLSALGVGFLIGLVTRK